MKSTIHLSNKHGVQMIAHRGLSGIEPENTVAAFALAAEHSYFGIETDIHPTADGRYILIHDDSTGRVAAENLPVTNTDFATLRALKLKECNGEISQRGLQLSTLEEYLDICRKSGKTAVLELKNHIEKADISQICDRIRTYGYLEKVIFISFDFAKLVAVREVLPNQPVQFLTGRVDDEQIACLKARRFDLDAEYHALNAETVEKCHTAGIRVNCWTVDDPEAAAQLIQFGVDYITTNILE